MRIFISAERSELTTEENAERTEVLDNVLTELEFNFESVFGKYEGKNEASFVVYTISRIPELMQLMKRFEQDSILVVDNNSSGMLIMSSGALKNLEGRFVKVDSSRVADLSAYSKIDGQYYAFQ